MSADDWSTLSVDAPANSVTVGNLSLFVTYEFKVRSVNSVGVSEYSLPLAHYTELGRSSLHSLSFTMLALHTHTHPFNGPLSRTTRVSWYQKGKTNLDFTEGRDSEWQ